MAEFRRPDAIRFWDSWANSYVGILALAGTPATYTILVFATQETRWTTVIVSAGIGVHSILMPYRRNYIQYGTQLQCLDHHTDAYYHLEPADQSSMRATPDPVMCCFRSPKDTPFHYGGGIALPSFDLEGVYALRAPATTNGAVCMVDAFKHNPKSHVISYYERDTGRRLFSRERNIRDTREDMVKLHTGQWKLLKDSAKVLHCGCPAT